MKRLENLVVKKVTLVSAGANPDADIVLYKSEDAMPDAKDTKELTDQLAKVQEELKGQDEKVKRSVLDVLKSIFGAEKKDEQKADTELAKRDEVIAKQNDRIAKLEDERERDAYITKAQSLGLVGDDWAALLRKAETGMSAEERKAFGERMASMAKVAKDSKLFAELGSNGAGEGDTWGKIEKLAEGVVAKSSGSIAKAQAISDVLKTDEGAALYTQYLNEQTKGAR